MARLSASPLPRLARNRACLAMTPGTPKAGLGCCRTVATMDPRSERIARRFDMPMLVAALLVVPVVAVEQSSLGEPWTSLASVLNWAIWIAFASEVVVMLAVVPNKWRWVRTHPLEIFIVVATPPFIPTGLAGARALRLLRLFRLLRLASLARRTFSLAGLR